MLNTLVMGNKNYSSWSLRPWLFLKMNEIEFEEKVISLYKADSKEKLLPFSPSLKVPVLISDNQKIWDSLAICEWVNEEYSQVTGWPQEKMHRALARSAVCEMHSGFFEIRNKLPMNCRTHAKVSISNQPALVEEVNRIDTLWNECFALSDSREYLFGEFSIADAMFAPVALRMHNYQISLSEKSLKYIELILSLKPMKQWIKEGVIEPDVIDDGELNYVLEQLKISS